MTARTLRPAGTAVPVTRVRGYGVITLGAATGQLLAQAVLEGEAPPELAPLDPLR